MQIRVSRHVDHTGKVYLPYLHEWNHANSDLLVRSNSNMKQESDSLRENVLYPLLFSKLMNDDQRNIRIYEEQQNKSRSCPTRGVDQNLSFRLGISGASERVRRVRIA